MILSKPIILYTVDQYKAESEIKKEYSPVSSKMKIGTWYDLVDRLCLKHKIVKMYPISPIVWHIPADVYITKILYDLAESVYQIAMKNYPPTNSYTVNNITALYKKFREKERYVLNTVTPNFPLIARPIDIQNPWLKPNVNLNIKESKHV